jgi:glycosyltransferase involved in cell wall biosynthesis
MSKPRVSVIIPTYNSANYLAEAVQSVLTQTLSDLEVIVVNDASTDHTDEIISQFDDPRVRYFVHETNRYAAAARNTGIRAAAGDYIAFLDADDLMHPEKLQSQVVFLDEHPDVGLSYTYRLTIDGFGSPLFIETNPPVVTLSDLVTSYPFAPSEVVMRKEWVLRAGMFDESFTHHSEDPDFHMRLALQGCKMAGLSRAFNYRRLFANKQFGNLAGVFEDAVHAFERAFSDPKCPTEVFSLRDKSFGTIHRIFAFQAFFQGEADMARELVMSSTRLDPSLLDNEAHAFREAALQASVRAGGEHEGLLRSVFEQLPAELSWLSEYTDLAVGRGYLIRGIRDVMWERFSDGANNLDKASKMGIQLDESFYSFVTAHLLNFNAEFGNEATETVLQNLSLHLAKLGNQQVVRHLPGHYWLNHAFYSYRNGGVDEVWKDVLRAIVNNPQYMANRGVLSILVRTVGGSTKAVNQ